VLTVATLVAWPGVSGGSPDGYLVNCWAYRASEPRRDDLVWYRPTPSGAPRVGRVVAEHGQEVEWSGTQLWVEGRPDRRGDVHPPGAPRALSYQVPEGHVLVRPEGMGAVTRLLEAPMVVGRDQILGRAWVRFYPVRERRFL
jgi:hypothetical protein